MRTLIDFTEQYNTREATETESASNLPCLRIYPRIWVIRNSRMVKEDPYQVISPYARQLLDNLLMEPSLPSAFVATSLWVSCINIAKRAN